MLEKSYFQLSVYRIHYLWWATVGGNTNRRPDTTMQSLWLLKFLPSCLAVPPQSPLSAVPAFLETTKQLASLLVLICVLLS